jgi:hypothetical protein
MGNPDDHFHRGLIAKANAAKAEMRGMDLQARYNFVARVVAEAQVAVGVFPDPQEKDGFGHHLIKGRKELEASVANNATVKLMVAAIPCNDLEQAVATERVLGDSPDKLADIFGKPH